MAKFTKAKKVISAITAVSVLGTAVATSSFAVAEENITKGDVAQSLTSTLSISVDAKFAEYTVSLGDFDPVTAKPGESFQKSNNFKVNCENSGNKGGVKLGELELTPPSDDVVTYYTSGGWDEDEVYAPLGEDTVSFYVEGLLDEVVPVGTYSMTVTANYSYDETATPGS